LEGSEQVEWINDEGTELEIQFHCISTGKWQVQIELELPYYRDLELHFWKHCRVSQWSWLRLVLGYCPYRLILAGAGVYLAVFGLERMQRLGQLPGREKQAREPEDKSLMRKSETF